MKRTEVNFESVAHVPTASFRRSLPAYLKRIKNSPIALYQDEELRGVILSPEDGMKFLEVNYPRHEGEVADWLFLDTLGNPTTKEGVFKPVQDSTTPVEESKDEDTYEETSEVTEETQPEEIEISEQSLGQSQPEEQPESELEAEDPQGDDRPVEGLQDRELLEEKESPVEAEVYTCQLDKVKNTLCTTAPDKSPGQAVVEISFRDKQSGVIYGPVYFCDFHYQRVISSPHLFEVEQLREL